MGSAGLIAPSGDARTAAICALLCEGFAPGTGWQDLVSGLHTSLSWQSVWTRHWMQAIWLSQNGRVASTTRQLLSVTHTLHSPRLLLAVVSQKSVVPGAAAHCASPVQPQKLVAVSQAGR